MSFWVAGAVVGGSLLSGYMGSNAASDAADAQSNAAAASNATQRYMYDTTRQDNMPALDARNASLAKMRELLGIGEKGGGGVLGKAPTASDVMAEPGYQFGLTQGMNALNNQLTARGMRNSGAALKAAARYGTDYAASKYDNAFNRMQSADTNRFNRFASLAGAGQVGANTIGQAGQNYANQVGATQQSLGNALAASEIAKGNAWGNAVNQIGGWYMNRP